MITDQPLKPGIHKTVYKRIAVVLVILLAIIAVIYYLAFDVIVPKAAAFTIPQKWRMVPLSEPRETVRSYFGEPLPESNLANGDVWANGSKGKMYFLTVYYLNDSIAVGYSIHYRFKNWVGSRDYVVDSLMLRD